MNHPKPSAMPSKTIGAQIVSALIETKSSQWTHKAIDHEATVDPKKPVIIETVREGRELRFPLAQNVSELSVERAAKALL